MSPEKKTYATKLSFKIIFMLFVILVGVITAVFFIVHVAQGLGLEPPKDDGQIRGWLRLVILIFALSVGVSILMLFSFAINRTLVARIRRLEDAAREVAKGNFDIRVDESGTDELSRLTDSFNDMSAELRANEYLNKEFVRNISHEFKTPISAIRAYGELLETAAENGAVETETVKEYAGIIVKESDRLADLSKNVLQLSLLDSTTIVKKEDRFLPAEQIRDSFRLMQAKWSEKNLTPDLNLEDVEITGNERLTFSIWQNLIGNAIKFSRENGVISVTLKKTERGIFCTVRDNGIGIKEADQAKIFDHFFMADTSRNSEGSGLGLPIVKKILSKVGGTITFESREGEGAAFFVELYNSV